MVVSDRDEDRFWSKVAIPADIMTGCWWWGLSVGSHGYGQVQMAGRKRLATRVAFELVKGEIPRGLCVMHTCDDKVPPGDTSYRRCVNPAHLRLGTNADNSRDMKAKLRSPLGSRNRASKLSDAQVSEIRSRYAGGESMKRIAEGHCVGYHHIWQLCVGRRRVT